MKKNPNIKKSFFKNKQIIPPRKEIKTIILNQGFPIPISSKVIFESNFPKGIPKIKTKIPIVSFSISSTIIFNNKCFYI